MFLPPKMSKDLAYISGVLLGDGNITIRKEKGEYAIKCVGGSKDEREFYEGIICPLFHSLFGKQLKVKIMDGGSTVGVRFCSKQLVNFFTKELEHPIGKKYETIKIPSAIKESKQEVAFLRGLFDTDGCFCLKKRYRENPYYPVISFSTKSHSFCSEVVSALKRNNVLCCGPYKSVIVDGRAASGKTTCFYLNINGREKTERYLSTINFNNPKHKAKIKKWRNSGRWI